MNRLLLCSLLVAAGTRCLAGAALEMTAALETEPSGSQLSIDIDQFDLAGLVASDASDIIGFDNLDAVDIFEDAPGSAADLNSPLALHGRPADERFVAFKGCC